MSIVPGTSFASSKASLLGFQVDFFGLAGTEFGHLAHMNVLCRRGSGGSVKGVERGLRACQSFVA